MFNQKIEKLILNNCFIDFQFKRNFFKKVHLIYLFTDVVAIDKQCGCRFEYCQVCSEVFKPSQLYLNEETRSQLDEDDFILERFKQLVYLLDFLCISSICISLFTFN